MSSRNILSARRIRWFKLPARAVSRPRAWALAVERLEDRVLLNLDFSFAKGIGGDQIEVADTATDAAGNEYLSGSFFGTVDFDPGNVHPGNTDLVTSFGQRDMYVAKYSATGAFMWARGAGGSLDDRALALATDGSGNVYATGYYTGTASFGGGLTLTDTLGAGIFVWKLDAVGNPIWAVGPAGIPHVVDQGVGIVVDGSGAIDVTGSFRSTITFTTPTGDLTLTAGGSSDAFLAKLDSAGTFLWAKSLTMQASTSFGQGVGVAGDGSGNVYAVGVFSGTIDLDPGPGTDLHTSPGGTPTLPTTDAFALKLDSSGNFVWGKSYGASDLDDADSIALDGTGGVYLIGRFTNTVDFDSSNTHPGNVDIIASPGGLYGLFVLKLDTSGGFGWVRNLGVGNVNLDIGRPGLALDGMGHLYAGGAFAGTANVGSSTLSSAGDSDIFVARLDTTGNILEATRGGGAGLDTLEGISFSATGRIVTGGNFIPPATFGNFTLSNQGSNNIFLTELVFQTPPTRSTQGDYDADQKADLAVYRPPPAQWFIQQSTLGGRAVQFGAAFGDIPIPADYDGDGKTDLAVFRPSTATWFILQSTAGPKAMQFGGIGDIPIPADYDGDRKADLAVFRPSTATWFILQSTAGPLAKQFGGVGIDVPVQADYDGDGRTDLAVFRTGTAQWFILQSTAGPRAQQFGQANFDQPLPADYDGDGKADLAVLRPNSYTWFIMQSTAGPRVQQFGTGGDVPILEDFDGDGRTDLAVYRPSSATWFIMQSTAGPRRQQFGQANVDVPLTTPLQYRYAGDTRVRTADFRADSFVPQFSAGADAGPLVVLTVSSWSNATQRKSRTAELRDLALVSALDQMNTERAGNCEDMSDCR